MDGLSKLESSPCGSGESGGSGDVLEGGVLTSSTTSLSELSEFTVFALMSGVVLASPVCFMVMVDNFNLR